jgi:hypothetical protein
MAKKTKAAPGELGKPYKKEVLCGISEDVKKTKQDRITEALGDVKKTKGEMKEATSGHRKAIRELENEIENLRTQVTSGKELRAVSVAEHKDFRRNLVEIVRVDTREVVDTREMTIDERQETFPDAPRGRKQRALSPGDALATARAEGGEA